MPVEPASQSDLVHEFKNCLAIIVGFSDILLAGLADDDPQRRDVAEIRKAANAALALVPQLRRDLS